MHILFVSDHASMESQMGFCQMKAPSRGRAKKKSRDSRFFLPKTATEYQIHFVKFPVIRSVAGTLCVKALIAHTGDIAKGAFVDVLHPSRLKDSQNLGY